MEDLFLKGEELPTMLLETMLSVYGNQVAIAHQLAVLTSLIYTHQLNYQSSTEDILLALAERADAAKGQMAYELYKDYGNVPLAIRALLDRLTGGGNEDEELNRQP